MPSNAALTVNSWTATCNRDIPANCGGSCYNVVGNAAGSTGTLTSQLQSAEVNLVSMLGSSTISLRQILSMKVGDVIPIQIPERVSGAVDGVPVVECQYGIQNGRYALRVERFANESLSLSAWSGEKHV